MYKNFLVIIRFLFLCCLTLFANCYVLATTPVNPVKKLTRQEYDKKLEKERKHVQDLVANYKGMKEPPNFPDLPAYAGEAKFVGGFIRPNNNGITSCEMNYFCKDDPQTVISFYKGALPANGWKILYATENCLGARMTKGHMCNISASESRLSKTKSKLRIDYRQIEP